MAARVTNHSVTLPYPDRGEPTVGRCTCGWSVVYGWGHHGDGQDAGEQHISDTTLTEPVVMEQFGGARFVIPGRSL